MKRLFMEAPAEFVADKKVYFKGVRFNYRKLREGKSYICNYVAPPTDSYGYSCRRLADALYLIGGADAMDNIHWAAMDGIGSITNAVRIAKFYNSKLWVVHREQDALVETSDEVNMLYVKKGATVNAKTFALYLCVLAHHDSIVKSKERKNGTIS